MCVYYRTASISVHIPWQGRRRGENARAQSQSKLAPRFPIRSKYERRAACCVRDNLVSTPPISPSHPPIHPHVRAPLTAPSPHQPANPHTNAAARPQPISEPRLNEARDRAGVEHGLGVGQLEGAEVL